MVVNVMIELVGVDDLFYNIVVDILWLVEIEIK